MSRAQREKGKRGEREFAALLENHGFSARRDGRLDDDLAHDVDGYHFEVKRRETLALPAWHRQAEQDAGDRVAVVAYRRNAEPWRASLDAEQLVRLLSIERAARAVVAAEVLRASSIDEVEPDVYELSLALARDPRDR
jgi:hypothetical protein